MDSKDYLIMELKGLLGELRTHVSDTKIRLDKENIQYLTAETEKMRCVIDRINQKVIEHNEIDEDEEES